MGFRFRSCFLLLPESLRSSAQTSLLLSLIVESSKCWPPRAALPPVFFSICALIFFETYVARASPAAAVVGRPVAREGAPAAGRRETRRAKRRARDGVASSRARRPARGAERAGPRRARTCAAAAAFAPRQGGPSADDDALRDGRTRARTSSLIVFLTVFGARKVRWRFEMGLAFLAALVGLRMPWAMAALVYIACASSVKADCHKQGRSKMLTIIYVVG